MIASLKHDASPAAVKHSHKIEHVQKRVIFFGNPNAGKTTLFNRLTGLRAKTANYPGTTVEVRVARMMIDGALWEWIDLPGLYSLDGSSPDERVAADYLE